MKQTYIVALGVSLALSASLQAQLPSQKVLTIEVAQAIAQEAMMKCRADGFKVVVSVVDAGGVLKAFLRDDGTANGMVQIVGMKINSVMAFGNPSGPPANLPAGAPVPPPFLPGTVNFMGAVPIKVDNKMIGAVGVSGAPGGDKDAACANFALAKLADKLK